MTMIYRCCHSNSINTGSRLPNISDVKTRKRRNVVVIDMIGNNHITSIYSVCLILYYALLSAKILSALIKQVMVTKIQSLESLEVLVL